MVDPTFETCTENEWTKVATSVTEGVLHLVNTKPKYLQTYRATGGAAPAAGDPSEGVEIFEESYHETIYSVAAIDVYIFCTGGDGRVRLDKGA